MYTVNYIMYTILLHYATLRYAMLYYRGPGLRRHIAVLTVIHCGLGVSEGSCEGSCQGNSAACASVRSEKNKTTIVDQAFVAAEGRLAQEPKKFEAALFILRKKAANVKHTTIIIALNNNNENKT